MAVPSLDTNLSKVTNCGQLLALKWDLGGDELQNLEEGARKPWAHSGGVTTFTWVGHGLVQNDRVTVSSANGGLVYGRFSVLSVAGDNFSVGLPVTWTRSGTVITCTSNWHQVYAGAQVWISGSSDTAALPNGLYTVATYIDSDRFTITGVDAGGPSGTCAAIRNSGSSGDACVFRDKNRLSIRINLGSPVYCPLFAIDRQWLYVRIPDANILSGGESVSVSIPAGFLSHSGRTDTNEAITDQGITNEAGVETLPDTPPANAADMRIGINSASTPYYGTLYRFTDILGVYSREEGACLLDQLHWGGSALLDFDRDTGMPLSVGSGTIIGWGLNFYDDDDVFRRNYPTGLWTVRWKGTATPYLSPGSGSAWSTTPVASGDNGAWHYRVFNVTTAETAGIYICVTGPGTITDLQVILPGYSTGGSDPSQLLADDYTRIHSNPPFKHWRSMSAGYQVGASRNCNLAKWAHLPPETYKLNKSKSSITTAIVGVVSLGLNTNDGSARGSVDPFFVVGEYIFEIEHAAGDVFSTGQGVTFTNYTAGTRDWSNYIIRRIDATHFRVGLTSATAPSGSIFQTVIGGLSLKRMCDLCNAQGWDLWYNVPHAMDDDGVTQIADYLAANLVGKVIVEYGNENWNWLFAQSRHCYGMGNSDPDITGDIYQRTYRYSGKRAAQVHKIFYDRYTAAGVLSKLRRNISGHGSNSYTTEYVFNGYREYCVAQSLPFTLPDYVAYTIYMGAQLNPATGAGPGTIEERRRDFFCGGALTFSMVKAGLFADLCEIDAGNMVNVRHLPHKALVDGWNTLYTGNIQRVLYECGWAFWGAAYIGNASSLDGGKYTPGTDIIGSNAYYFHRRCKEGHRHPRMARVYMKSFKDCVDNGVIEYSAFLEVTRWSQGGYWGLCEYQTQVVGPGDGREGGNNNLLNIGDGDDVEAVKAWAFQQWTAEEPPPPPPVKRMLVRK